MEPNNNEQEKKKVNEDLVVFMRKRSDHEAPRYTARLKTYVDIQRKRRRAAAARRHSDHCYHEKKSSATGIRKKVDGEQKDKVENNEHPGSEDGRMSRRGIFNRRGGEEKGLRGRSMSRSRSGEPSERCGRRRRRKRCGRRRRRRRSCRRRRRRRRSCRRRRRRRSCRRRRRRSCSRRRRRRRRSCRRRRRRRC